MDEITMRTADPREAFRADVLEGLARPVKSIPPKYFYDRRGSELFDRICELPEYYPTRTEIGILEANAAQMVEAMGPNAALVEFGAGALTKVRYLLDQRAAPDVFVPIDISGEHLQQAASALATDYPGIDVIPVVGDYSAGIDLPDDSRLAGRRLIGFFPGSTIGNMNPDEARRFLERARETLDGGAFLIGADLIKDRSVLNAAYNDAAGVTAAFNLNLIRRINEELDGDFDLDAFRHQAYFDEADSRIEMHLESLKDQDVSISGVRFSFRAGETIHTENSHKFSIDGFQDMARDAGYRSDRVWTDADDYFSLHLLSCD